MICPHCAFPNEDGRLTCAKCRLPLQDGPIPPPRVTQPEPVPPPDPSPTALGETPVVAAASDVREVLAEAEIKEVGGDLRGAFLACQALVIDRFGSLEEDQLVAIYLVMGRVSLKQGKRERARKYLLKAYSLKPDAPGLAEMMRETERPVEAPPSTPPAPPGEAAPEPDDAFETPEEPAPAAALPRPPAVEPEAPAPPPAPVVERDIAETASPRVSPGPFVREPDGPALGPPPLPDRAPPPSPVRAPRAQPEPASEGRLVFSAGFWLRSAALAVDVLLLLGLQVAMIMLGALVLGSGPSAVWSALGSEPIHLAIVLALFLTLLISYLTVFARFGGQTVGKMLLGLRVVGLDGRSLGTWQALRRLLGMLLAGLPGLAGFLWAAFDLNRRGWHDRVGGTLVVRTRPPRAALAAPDATKA